MSCNKYILTNTGATVVNFNYQRCDDSMWEYQVELKPDQTKNVWLINGTYSTAFSNSIDLVNNGSFPPQPILMTYQLGRHVSVDSRDNNYLISQLLPQKVTSITSKYWQNDIWNGDQGKTPMCVGYAWAHFIEDGPITHSGVHPVISPVTIYKEAQKVDEWPGENYNGTSVRGGAKYLLSSNKISSYLWAFDINTLISTVLNVGPVVVGSNWYNGMFYPDRNGLIKISGRIAGGHAYVINGIDTNSKLFRIKNSWGKSWGQGGHVYISFADMTRLIKENGEVCLAVENRF